MDSFAEQNLTDFTTVLASKAAVPGGGGASALVGSIGSALGSMVGNLTVGKKKYADVEDEVKDLMDQCDKMRVQMLKLIDADAAAFEPLSKAYSIPKDDPTRPATMAKVLKDACGVPMDIMRTACEIIDLLERLGQIGSKLAISDVGVGVIDAKAALMGASLNVFINTKSMEDRELAEKLEAEADKMLSTYTAKADAVYGNVLAQLRG
ncbi:MAG: cyclodeaminase/cyclohydrolase family protein [Coriobacteriales bacterium]|nr:cyclodeaminase/cyclohydrolase family protein [Coriobacteriales bacterium]